MSNGPFRLVQFEFGFPLGPEDGRYLVRNEDGGADLVVVLTTFGAPTRRNQNRGRPSKMTGQEPEAVAIQRATLVDPEAITDQKAAELWLREIKSDEYATGELITRALTQINSVLSAHRSASLHPYVRDVNRELALVTRVGFGIGDQVIEGQLEDAFELRGSRRKVKRGQRLAPQQRLAEQLARRRAHRVSSELVLRARLDLDADRMREAALQTRIALEAAIAEFGSDAGTLAASREGVSKAANAALDGSIGAGDRPVIEEAVKAIEHQLRRDQPAPE